MVYLGSKKRLAKDIVPILQQEIEYNHIDTFIDCFCGGCNIVDKIQCNMKVASDVHHGLIELMKHVQNHPEDIPEDITEDEYNYVRDHKTELPEWYVALVGFNASYAGKYFGGFGRDKDNRRRPRAQSVLDTLRKQDLSNIWFVCCDYKTYSNVEDCLIYCDPPYRKTTGYKHGIAHEDFYNWCRKVSQKNKVFISEREMPDDFKIVWEKEFKQRIPQDGVTTRVERLFTL